MVEMNETGIINENDYPQAILEDFEIFLNYVKDHPVKLTKTRNYITKKDLRNIHLLLTEREPLITKKGNQDDYPLIHLLFHLALSLRVAIRRKMNNVTVLAVDTDMFDLFRSLDPPEQYATLLAAFWEKVDWEDLDEKHAKRAYKDISIMLEQVTEMENLSNGVFLDDSSVEQLRQHDIRPFLCYWDYFGLIDLVCFEEEIENTDETFQINIISVDIKPLMQKLGQPLLEVMDMLGGADATLEDFFSAILGIDPIMDEQQSVDTDDDEDTSLFAMLQPLFAEEVIYTLPALEESKPFEGSIVFKVSLAAKCWRKIQLPASATLFDLHRLIQDAFAFDDDHMYSFFMDGKPFSKHAYNSPMDSSGPFVQEAILGKLDLYEGMCFLYLFDFGDEWHFQVEVEKMIEGEEKTGGIVAAKGENPDQYAW